MEIHYTDTDEARTRQALPYVVTALDNVVAAARQYSRPADGRDELRPVNPGEQRYFTGELYLPRVSGSGVRRSRFRAPSWASFIGCARPACSSPPGSCSAPSGVPRVNNDDDFPSAVGLWVWTHVGAGPAGATPPPATSTPR